MKNTILNLADEVSSIMTTELTTVQDNTPYEALKNLFSGRGIHHVLVENKAGELQGIISTEDMSRSRHFVLFEDKIEAQHIMTAKPTEVRPDTPIRKVLELFLDNRFRALPVVNEDNVLIGVVTPFDIMHELLEGA